MSPAGLACVHVERCTLCGTASCECHRMATYRLKVYCPREVNPRTKWGKALLAALAAIGAPLPRRKKR